MKVEVGMMIKNLVSGEIYEVISKPYFKYLLENVETGARKLISQDHLKQDYIIVEA